MKKLNLAQKIEVIQEVIRISNGYSSFYMCNAITHVCRELDFLGYKENEKAFLNNNFSELCKLAEKYNAQKLTINTKFIFNGDVWFHGEYYKGLKVDLLQDLLQELLKSYKNRNND